MWEASVTGVHPLQVLNLGHSYPNLLHPCAVTTSPYRAASWHPFKKIQVLLLSMTSKFDSQERTMIHIQGYSGMAVSTVGKYSSQSFGMLVLKG